MTQESKLRILTWNVAHQAKNTLLRQAHFDVLLDQGADIIVLTEFVPNDSRTWFYEAMASTGYIHQLKSRENGKHNHVLAFSKLPIENLNILTPDFPTYPATKSSALYFYLSEFQIEILGLRIPSFKKKKFHREYWQWIEERTQGWTDRRCILIGDFNTDPSYSRAKGGDRIGAMTKRGWIHSIPEGGFSYFHKNGSRSRIDHAFLSSHFRITEVRYITTFRGENFIGFKGDSLSDHAICLLDLVLK